MLGINHLIMGNLPPSFPACSSHAAGSLIHLTQLFAIYHHSPKHDFPYRINSGFATHELDLLEVRRLHEKQRCHHPTWQPQKRQADIL